MIFHPDQAFDLPPLPPALEEKDLFNPKITQLVIKANRSISELKGACHALPNAYPLLLNIYQTAGKHLSELEQNKILNKKKSGTYKLYYNPSLLDCLKT